MFGSEVIEVGIGMAVLFFFMSLIATALCEALENIIKSRAKYLEQGIGEIFRDLPGFVDKFYRHPLIASLYSGTYQPKAQNLPSYIPRQSFSLALLDLLSDSRTGFSIDALKTSLQTSLADDKQDPNPLRKLLLSVIDTAGGDIDKTRKLLEEWYDGTMDRVSGWYKRRTGYVLAAIGISAAIAFNVDAIAVAKGLIRDKALRAAVVEQAETIVTPAGQTALQGKSLEQLDLDFKSIGFPIGWTLQDGRPYPSPQSCKLTPAGGGEPVLSCDNRSLGILQAIPGWLITALAIMLGAPFWFDVLNKLMVIRSTVKPNEKSPDESSEDRQAKSSTPASPQVLMVREPPPAEQSPPPEAPLADRAQAVHIASNIAVADNVFEPHTWVNDIEDPQRGVV